MADKNLHLVEGRVGDAPEVRFTQGNKAVANFSVASTEKNYDGTKEFTAWTRCVAWGKGAEGAARLNKGDHVMFVGRVQTRKWQDKDGNDRYTTETVVDGPVFKAMWPTSDQSRTTSPNDDAFDDEPPF